MVSNDLLLTVSPASGSGDALATQGLTLFATTILAWLFVALFQFQAFKKAIVLNFLFQNAHGFFEIVVENLDFDCFQTGSTPLFPIHFEQWSESFRLDGYFENTTNSK